MTSELERQRKALHEGALVVDAIELGTLAATGADRKTWLNAMLTCDLAPLHPGDGAFGLAVAKTGKLLAELFVVVDEETIFVGLLRERAASLQEHLDRHLIMEDAAIVDASGEHAWFVVHGPLANDAAIAAREAGGIVATIDRTGLGGAVLVSETGRLDAVLRALQTRLGTRVALATTDGWEQLRIEQGLGRFGVDYDEDNYPQEASLEQSGVSFSKGCYLGQEAVFMLEKRGHAKKKLVRLMVEGEADLPPGATIALPNGTAVGNITSRAPGPTGGVVALGYVKWKHSAPATDLVVDGRAARVG